MVVLPDGARYAELIRDAISRVATDHLMAGEPVREWVVKETRAKRGEAARKAGNKALKTAKKREGKGGKKADEKLAGGEATTARL